MTKKQRKKFALGASTITAVVAVPIATVVSCGFNGDYSTNYLHDRRDIHAYGTLSSELKQRTFDVQYTSGNVVSNVASDTARTLPLMRTKTTGENIGEVSNGYDKNGKYDPSKIGMHWKETTKEERAYSGAQEILGSIDGITFEKIDISKMDDIAVKAKLSKYTKYKFIINKDGKAKWMDSKGKATEYSLNAKDYFYGWVRAMYSSKETRETGKVSGIARNGMKPFKKGWSTNDIDTSTNNSNSYLFDLFGLDIEATYADGEKLTDSDHELVLTLDTPTDKFLDSIISDNSSFTPAPSKYIDEMAKGSQEPSIRFGVVNYGKKLEQFLHVAPYYYSAYDPLIGYTVEQNEGFINQDWVHNKDLPKGQARIKKYIYHATQKQDAIASVIQRKTGYEEGKESILDAAVLGNASELEKIKSNADKYGARMAKVIKTGNQQATVWNPLPNDEFLNKYNDQGRKLMYGLSSIDDIKKKPSALKHFISGDAAKLRHAIDLAYNWYAGVRQVTGDSSKMALLSPLAPEQKIFEGSNLKIVTTADIIAAETKSPSSVTDAQKIYTRPNGVPSYAELKKSYSQSDDKIKASTSPSFKEAQKLISSIAQKYSGAIIPLQTWNDKNKNAASQQTLAQMKAMIEVLNKIAPGKITFKNEIPQDWNTHVKNIQYHDGQFQYVGWGPDYNAATSVLQGIMQPSSMAGIIGQYLDDGNNSELKKLVDSSKDYNKFKTVASTLSLAEWKQYSVGDIDKLSDDKKEALREAKVLTAGGYLTKYRDEAFVNEMVSFLQNRGLFFHTTIVGRNIIVTDRLQGSYSIQVMKKWLHTRTQKSGKVFLRDYSVDL